MNELEKLSQEQDQQETTTPEPTWACPICSIPQPPDDTSFNAHIDYCLSKQTIKEVVKSTTAPLPLLDRQNSAAKTGLKKGGGGGGGNKRARTKGETQSGSEEQAREKRRAFFSLGNG
ncbi:ZnF-Rad18 domain containing protein [Pyrenophora tritici-repentis]|nr:ZnF-Rad18 domain containing protein [Pyrenophora tritici-repentis]KAI1543840.1 ZnF-Rad18 domain containing protein [Pyrenophora tritici-repentis]KAI1546565.1 hypothetical protein PtrSN001C_002781 [Pyrenophora tritici-repentis]KAI1555609.1 ZnF-Rad18 domain containing protein [Pyrenophora tritici-repentis]KAI1574773.1 ZnF-Rad18 domain containing protein [Pyrenophora tritici-repentis]